MIPQQQMFTPENRRAAQARSVQWSAPASAAGGSPATSGVPRQRHWAATIARKLAPDQVGIMISWAPKVLVAFAGRSPQPVRYTSPMITLLTRRLLCAFSSAAAPRLCTMRLGPFSRSSQGASLQEYYMPEPPAASTQAVLNKGRNQFKCMARCTKLEAL